MISRKLLFTFTLSLILISAVYSQDKKTVILNGLEMVPDIQTGATGSGEAWIKSDTLYVQLEFKNLKSAYFAANIHFGEKGETGNPIFKLHPDNLNEEHTSGAFEPSTNKFALSDALKEAFKNGTLYVTVASEQHQRGEIRGQIGGL